MVLSQVVSGKEVLQIWMSSHKHMTRSHSPAFWLMASELTVKFQHVMKYYTKLQAWTGSLRCPVQQKIDITVLLGMSGVCRLDS